MFYIIEEVWPGLERMFIVVALDGSLENSHASRPKQARKSVPEGQRVWGVLRHVERHKKVAWWQLDIGKQAASDLHPRIASDPFGHLFINFDANALVAQLPQLIEKNAGSTTDFNGTSSPRSISLNQRQPVIHAALEFILLATGLDWQISLHSLAHAPIAIQRVNLFQSLWEWWIEVNVASTVGTGAVVGMPLERQEFSATPASASPATWNLAVLPLRYLFIHENGT